ncbi:MAG: hypothetical protein LBL39_04395 [Planctomycetaceae bacterium]|nr:hypothetical protein [Planctomycetaceae bacterium]
MFLISFFFSGCDRRGGGGVIVSPTGGVVANDPARQVEDFLREISVLNSLEGSPCLPDTQGAEKIVQTGDRLNSWIKRKRLDETWKSEAEFVAMEALIRRGVTSAESLVKLLYILQGKNAEGNAIEPANNSGNNSGTLVAECKEAVRCLVEFENILTELGKRIGTTDLGELLVMISGMREKFSAVESIANINAGAIRAFAKRFEQETEQIAGVAAHFNNFATSVRTEELFIQTSDVYYLIQSIWLRDISNWARGDKQDVLERVKNIFDWTVCNISVRNRGIAAANNIALPLQLPWQSVLLGDGSELDRAWVFIELLRQQRIDAVMLAVEDSARVGGIFVWGVGVLVAGEVYVFVPDYGTALPAKGGLEFAEDGRLECKSIATFSQVLADDSLLRQLDISAERRFPVTSELLKKTAAFIVASPETVSMRMKVLEADLSGESSMILFTNINEQRKLFSASMSGVKVGVWDYPFHAKFDQLFKYELLGKYLNIFMTTNPVKKQHNFPLWSGRIQYFKGEITGQGGAMTCYQDARISDREMMELRAVPEIRNNKTLLQILQLTTNQAVFWIGIASFEINSKENAKDSMKGLLLETVNAWSVSESYILGRISEQEKNYAEAITHYEKAAKSSTQQPAFDLRAKWIREKTK